MEAGNVTIEEVTRVTLNDGGEMSAPWPVFWSAVWVGALSAISLTLIIGLVGVAIGAHRVGQPLASWREFGFPALVFSVFGAFISFAAGGWATSKIAGFRRSESAMLH